MAQNFNPREDKLPEDRFLNVGITTLKWKEKHMHALIWKCFYENELEGEYSLLTLEKNNMFNDEKIQTFLKKYDQFIKKTDKHDTLKKLFEDKKYQNNNTTETGLWFSSLKKVHWDPYEKEWRLLERENQYFNGHIRPDFIFKKKPPSKETLQKEHMGEKQKNQQMDKITEDTASLPVHSKNKEDQQNVGEKINQPNKDSNAMLENMGNGKETFQKKKKMDKIIKEMENFSIDSKNEEDQQNVGENINQPNKDSTTMLENTEYVIWEIKQQTNGEVEKIMLETQKQGKEQAARLDAILTESGSSNHKIYYRSIVFVLKQQQASAQASAQVSLQVSELHYSEAILYENNS